MNSWVQIYSMFQSIVDFICTDVNFSICCWWKLFKVSSLVVLISTQPSYLGCLPLAWQEVSDSSYTFSAPDKRMFVLFNESSYSETKILVQRRVIVMMLLFLGLFTRKYFSFFKRKYILILQFCIFDFTLLYIWFYTISLLYIDIKYTGTEFYLPFWFCICSSFL